jgi:hypothetical protein
LIENTILHDVLNRHGIADVIEWVLIEHH